MGFNKKVLSKAVSELGKAKAPGKPKDIIVDPAGQWKYPGQETRIPSNDITMQGVDYPVWAQPNVGPGIMMQPGQDYLFPDADYVDETPMAKKGGIAGNLSSDNKAVTKVVNIKFDLPDLSGAKKIDDKVTLAMSPDSSGVFTIGKDVEKFSGIKESEVKADIAAGKESPEDAIIYGLTNVMNGGKDVYLWINGSRLQGMAKKHGADKAITEVVSHEALHLARHLITRAIAKKKGLNLNNEDWIKHNYGAGEYNWPAVGDESKENPIVQIDEESFATAEGLIVEQILPYFKEMAKSYLNGADSKEFKKGGTLQSKKYSKSMSATNKLFTKNKLFQNKKSKIFDPNAKFKSGGSKLGPINLNPNPLSHYELNYGFNLPVKQDGGVSSLEGDLISKVLMNRNRDKGFVDRAYGLGANPGTPMFNVFEPDQFGQTMSHKMGWGTDDDGQAWMFPTVLNPDDEAIPVPNQYADYISSQGYKNATGMNEYQDGGESDYEELELTDEEIQAYKDAGYVVEELPEQEIGGYVQHEIAKAQTGLTKKPLVIADPKEFAYRNKMYNDSLSLYNASNSINYFRGLPKISKEKYDEIRKKDDELTAYIFDKKQHTEDKKNKKEKPLPEYVVKTTRKKMSTDPVYIKNLEKKQSRFDDPNKFAITLKDGTLKIPVIVENGKPNFTHFTIYDPSTGSRYYYSENFWDKKGKPNLLDVSNDNIYPVAKEYYGSDIPTEYEKFKITEESQKNGKTQSKLSNDYKNFSYDTTNKDIYAKPVQPVKFIAKQDELKSPIPVVNTDTERFIPEVIPQLPLRELQNFTMPEPVLQINNPQLPLKQYNSKTGKWSIGVHRPDTQEFINKNKQQRYQTMLENGQANMAQPTFQTGGTRKHLVITDPEEFTYRNNMYNDSLAMYNTNKISDLVGNAAKKVNFKIKNDIVPSKYTKHLTTSKSYNQLSPSDKRKIDAYIKNSPMPHIKPVRYEIYETEGPANKKSSFFSEDEYSKQRIKERFNELPATYYKKPVQPVKFKKIEDKPKTTNTSNSINKNNKAVQQKLKFNNEFIDNNSQKQIEQEDIGLLPLREINTQPVLTPEIIKGNYPLPVRNQYRKGVWSDSSKGKLPMGMSTEDYKRKNQEYINNLLKRNNVFTQTFQKGGSKIDNYEILPETFNYEERPGARYRRDNYGNWLVADKNTNGKFVAVKDKTGKRQAELNKNAISSETGKTVNQYYKEFDESPEGRMMKRKSLEAKGINPDLSGPQSAGNSDWFWGPAALAITGAPAAAQAIKTAAPLVSSALNTAPSWLPGATINNALTAGFAGHGLNEIVSGNVAEPWKKAMKSGKGIDYATALGENAMTALELAPLVGPPSKSLIKGLNASKESGLLSNAYKYNPWAFKPNPESYYRMGEGRKFIDDVLETNKIRAYNENSYANLRDAGKISGIREDGKIVLKAKTFPESDTYWSKGVPLDGRYASQNYGNYMIEASNDIPFIHSVNQRTKQKGFWEAPDVNYNSTHSKGTYVKPRQSYGYNIEGNIEPSIGTPLEYNSDLIKLYEPHWLKGYKEVPKQLPGSTNIPIRSGLGSMDMSKYEIKNPDYYTQLLGTYDSKVLSSKNKKFYKDLIEAVKSQDGLVTERQYNELQRLKSGNFDFGKKAYEEGGSIDAWEDELDDEEIERLKRAGYVVEEVDEYQTGGPTVSELWKQHTGTSWNEAHKLGLTSGSYEDNMKLRSRILNNEFDGITPQPQQVTQQVAQPVRNNVSAEEHKAQYIHNVKNLINNNKTIDDLVSMRVGTREGLLKLFPELSGSNTGNIKPVVKKQPASDPRRSAQVSPEATNLERYMKLTPMQQKFAEIKKLNDAKKINDAKKLSNAEKLSEANKLKQKEKVIKKEIKSDQWTMPNIKALGINAPDISERYTKYNQNKTVADNFNIKGNKLPNYVKPKNLKEVKEPSIYNAYIKPAAKILYDASPIKQDIDEINKLSENIKNSKVGELYESLKNEGLSNTISQVITSQKDPESYKTVVVPKKPKPVKPIAETKKEQKKFDADELATEYNRVVDAGDYTINTFSKKLNDTPLGIRNRGDERNIKGRAIAYTYAPFKTYEQHLNNRYGDITLRPNDKTTDNQPVIVYEGNKMFIDTFKNQKNTGRLISPTYKTNNVTDLVIDPSNTFHAGINQKMLRLKTETGSKDMPIGIADSDSNSYKDWSGGHLMIENPNTKEVVVLHGKSNELRDMFRKYLKENDLKSANIIETDHKTYSLIKNPKNNILTGEFNRARDNANTKSSGSGNFIYIKG